MADREDIRELGAEADGLPVTASWDEICMRHALLTAETQSLHPDRSVTLGTFGHIEANPAPEVRIAHPIQNPAQTSRVSASAVFVVYLAAGPTKTWKSILLCGTRQIE